MFGENRENLQKYQNRILGFIGDNPELPRNEVEVWKTEYARTADLLGFVNSSVPKNEAGFNEVGVKRSAGLSHLDSMPDEMLGPPMRVDGPVELDHDLQQWETDGGGTLWGDYEG